MFTLWLLTTLVASALTLTALDASHSRKGGY